MSKKQSGNDLVNRFELSEFFLNAFWFLLYLFYRVSTVTASCGRRGLSFADNEANDESRIIRTEFAGREFVGSAMMSHCGTSCLPLGSNCCKTT